jgi:aldehyde:ferredoxin oxidoreductase
VDVEEMKKASKKLARIIINHPVCGGALPAYGSITLMKMMKNNEYSTIREVRHRKIISEDQSVNLSIEGSRRINRTCAPSCVVGCLNRHARANETLLASPAESEVSAALEDFGIEDAEFASRFNRIAFEQCSISRD